MGRMEDIASVSWISLTWFQPSLKLYIANDRCHLIRVHGECTYTRLATIVGLFVRFYLFQSHSILCPAHPHLYIASFFTPGLCRSDMGVFLALGNENTPVQASIRLLALALRQPNH